MQLQLMHLSERPQSARRFLRSPQTKIQVSQSRVVVYAEIHRAEKSMDAMCMCHTTTLAHLLALDRAAWHAALQAAGFR